LFLKAHKGHQQNFEIAKNMRERGVYLFSPIVFIVVGFIFSILKSQIFYKEFKFLRVQTLKN